jgi:hypothetical protein
VLTAALFAVLAALLAGCAGEPPPAAEPTDGAPSGSGPGEHFTKIADLERGISTALRRDKTATTSTSATVFGPDGGSTPLPAGDGAVEFGSDGVAAHAFHPMTFDRAGPGLLEVIVLTTDTAYAKPPAGMGLSQPAGKPWIGPLQLAETVKGTRDQKLALLATRAARTTDPTRGFTADLYGAAAKIVEAVDEDLDGTPAVRYTIHVDVTRAVALQRDSRRKRTLQAYLDQGETSTDIGLWVDASSRPLRMTLRSVQDGRPRTVDIRYRDWGRAVDIAAPPAARTAR